MMYKTTENQKIHLYQIATEMVKSGLSPSFIAKAVKVAEEYEGVYDLMAIWMDENFENEREEVLADIQELIAEKFRIDKGLESKRKEVLADIQELMEEKSYTHISGIAVIAGIFIMVLIITMALLS